MIQTPIFFTAEKKWFLTFEASLLLFIHCLSNSGILPDILKLEATLKNFSSQTWGTLKTFFQKLRVVSCNASLFLLLNLFIYCSIWKAICLTNSWSRPLIIFNNELLSCICKYVKLPQKCTPLTCLLVITFAFVKLATMFLLQMDHYSCLNNVTSSFLNN